MKLYAFRGEFPNFGDELNRLLIPKVLPGLLDENEDQILLAIGSVLFNDFPRRARKVVFGSGYGRYTPPPDLDPTWDVHCVRGPLTAQALGLPPECVAADTAILANRHLRQPTGKRYRAGYIPHWESLMRADWAKVCGMANVTFIDPRWPVERVLDMIQACEMVIAEAMHGAIVADALRTPWLAVLPFHRRHHFKWQDWALALDLNLVQHRLPPASAEEARIWLRPGGKGASLIAAATRLAAPAIDPRLEDRAARSLERLSRQDPVLSSDASLERALEKLETSAGRILKTYGRAG
ncbi:polysaccharide pyruvyl transferase family protein [Prosthecomicrobium sp. N25]|uniref:polysaccharide pyruvyl transferase family protein n=1 Tax=Prosthecomicrobium sp. N25 TaxID=3129254 RepID=UPI0030787B92